MYHNQIQATNGKRSGGIATLAVVMVSLLVGCGGPRQKMLDTAEHRRRPANYPVDIYEGKVIESNREIAIIDSTAYGVNPNDDVKTRDKQLDELRTKARTIGADAVHDIRILTKRIEGYTIDERTPFPSWKQGEYPLYFIRGTAIAYASGLPGAVAAGKGYTDSPEGFIVEEDAAGSEQSLNEEPRFQIKSRTLRTQQDKKKSSSKKKSDEFKFP